MVIKLNQGDIIVIDFDPQIGHEQRGKRPALVISNKIFIQKSGLVVVCPITSRDKNHPFHIRLDERTKTKGVILCEHIRSLDVESRGWRFIEKAPYDIVRDAVMMCAEFNELCM